MVSSVLILETSLRTLPQVLAYKTWRGNGRICPQEHVHTVILAFHRCICSEDSEQEKLKCISSAIGIGISKIRYFMRTVDVRQKKEERRAFAISLLKGWLAYRKGVVRRQLSLLESARPSSAVEQAMEVAAKADQPTEKKDLVAIGSI